MPERNSYTCAECNGQTFPVLQRTHQDQVHRTSMSALLSGMLKVTMVRDAATGLFTCPGRCSPKFRSATPSVLRDHAKGCAPATNDAALRTLQLVYNAQWNVLLCLGCGVAVDVAGAEKHWSKHHARLRGSQAALLDALGDARPLQPHAIPYPECYWPRIPYLWFTDQAWCCAKCHQVTSSHDTLRTHWSKEHRSMARSQVQGRPCKAQRWLRVGACLFEVEGPQPEGARPVPALVSEARPQQVQRAQREQQQQQREAPQPQRQQQQPQQQRQNAVQGNADTWHQRCNLSVILQGGDRVALATCVDSGRSACKSAVEATVREVLQAGCQLLPSVPLFVKKRLSSLDDVLDASAVALSSESDATLLKYAGMWSRVLLFLVRAHEQLESEAQAREEGLLPAWKVLQTLNAEQRVSVANLSSYDEATRRSAVLDVSCFCIEQPLRNEGADSAIMVAFACLSIGSAEAWLAPAEAASIVKSLLYCSRVFSLLVHLAQSKLWDPTTLAVTQLHGNAAAKARCYEAFQDRHHETLSRASGTAVPRLATIGGWVAEDLDVPAAPSAAPARAAAAPAAAVMQARAQNRIGGMGRSTVGSGQVNDAGANLYGPSNAVASSSRSEEARPVVVNGKRPRKELVARSGGPRRTRPAPPQAGPSQPRRSARVAASSEEVDELEDEAEAPRSSAANRAQSARKRKSNRLSGAAAKRSRQLSDSEDHGEDDEIEEEHDDDDGDITLISIHLASENGRPAGGRRSQDPGGSENGQAPVER